MNLLNTFLKSKYFDNLNTFLAKKIFKIFKIFFVETGLQKLPDINYPLMNIKSELEKSKLDNKNNYRPYITYAHLPDLVEVLSDKNEQLNFVDIGAGNLNLYFYLKKNFKNINYFFKDQKEVETCVKDFIQDERLKNISVVNINSLELINIAYFGSSLQYIKDYKRELKNFFKKTNYILIAQSPFFSSKKNDEKIIIKQLNMHPYINYLYMFNYEKFLNFMTENNYDLIEKNVNNVTKFLNFKNFSKDFYSDINMYDLLFKLKKR